MEKEMKERIGDLLLKHGIITQEQLDKALKLQRKTKKRLGEIFLELGYLDSESLFWVLSEQAAIPFIDVHPEMLDQDLINLFPQKILKDNNALPLYETEEKIFVATGDPTSSTIVEQLSAFTKKEVVISCADPKRIRQLLGKIFQTAQSEEMTVSFKNGKMTVIVRGKNALLEFVNNAGIITKEKANINIVMEIGQEEGDKKHD